MGVRLDQAKMLEADLTGAELSGASLESANLSSANLTDVDASGAHLARALCSRTNFSGGCFVGADFTEAVFVVATLTDADFRGACLLGTRLSSSELAVARIDGSTQLALVEAAGARSRPGRPKSLDSIRRAVKETRGEEESSPTRPSRSILPDSAAPLARSAKADSAVEIPPQRSTRETFAMSRPSTGEHLIPPVSKAGILRRKKQRRDD